MQHLVWKVGKWLTIFFYDKEWLVFCFVMHDLELIVLFSSFVNCACSTKKWVCGHNGGCQPHQKIIIYNAYTVHHSPFPLLKTAKLFHSKLTMFHHYLPFLYTYLAIWSSTVFIYFYSFTHTHNTYTLDIADHVQLLV